MLTVVSMRMSMFGVVDPEELKKFVVIASAATKCERNGSDASIGVWVLMNVASLTASELQAFI